MAGTYDDATEIKKQRLAAWKNDKYHDIQNLYLAISVHVALLLVIGIALLAVSTYKIRNSTK